jgi:hypothetical protein
MLSIDFGCGRCRIRAPRGVLGVRTFPILNNSKLQMSMPMSESGIHTNTTTTWKCLRLSGYSTSERAAMTMVTARAESAIEPCRSAVVLLENLLDAVEPASTLEQGFPQIRR